MSAWLDKWKEILAGIAAVLVLILQIINVILSNDIDHTLVAKAQEMQRKADTVQQILDKLTPQK